LAIFTASDADADDAGSGFQAGHAVTHLPAAVAIIGLRIRRGGTA
jgi:hypothetical protein